MHDRNGELYSKFEEIINSTTHSLGIILGVVGTIMMIMKAKTGLHTFAYTVFGLSITFLYTMSTLYHGTAHKKLKNIFRKMDHIGIYLLIAGSYTPFLMLAIKGETGMWMMINIWALAFIGILIKVFAFNRSEVLTVVLCLIMGWMVIAIRTEMIASLSFDCLKWIVIGGACYMSGVLFYLRESLYLGHAIWHVCVLLGTTSHFYAVYAYV
ncbi:PAQR family membrane homeostasis protein TrhA [Halobacteriovorax sp. GFR7]|uniref:PAQR family membrane homeostasis protein TrhA n=1 Tax=unclassified Halobacteriovorax TaxID=2639665 RepID=UPI003D97C9EB